jgi:hypothetical protein
MTQRVREFISINSLIALISIAIFATCAHYLQYTNVLGESDLYRVLVGLLDGAVSGSGIASPVHYRPSLGFGYILGIYAFTPADLLRDPDALIRIMNVVGWAAAVIGAFFFWVLVLLRHGDKAALVSLIVFAFSPMVLDLASSGHQIVIAFAFFSIAAALLAARSTGFWAILLRLVAMLLLICGLSARAEIFLAFPYIVLSETNFTSLRLFFISALRASVIPIIAFFGYIVIRKHFATFPNEEAPVAFFHQFFHLTNVVPGFVYIVLGCGIATAALAILIVPAAIVRTRWNKRQTNIYAELGPLIAPIALVIIPFTFWITNPQPSRHFLLMLAGLAIFVGWAVQRVGPRSAIVTAFAAICVVVLNQGLSEVMRPTLLRLNQARSPYLPVAEAYGTFTHAPLGLIYKRQAALTDRRANWAHFGDQVATACDAKIVVLSDEAEQIIARLYVGGAGVRIEATNWRGYIAYTVRRGAHLYMILAKMNGWPRDAVSEVLSDPVLADYRIVADPQLMSVYDRTAIPRDRIAQLGCTAVNNSPQSLTGHQIIKPEVLDTGSSNEHSATQSPSG